MRLPLLLLLSCLFNLQLITAQKRCDYIHHNGLDTEEGKKQLAIFEQQIQQKILENRAKRNNQRTTGELYRIPVIVHVVHNGESIGEGPNISAEQVASQIEVLNEDFRGQNRNLLNTRPEFIGLAGDAEIEFVLATEDPAGNRLAEAGIHRYNGNQESWLTEDIEKILKPNTIYDPYRYLNIWTVKFTRSDLLGEAQWPSSGVVGLEGSQCVLTDGMMIGYQYFGSRQKYPSGSYQGTAFDKGRTATHEIGHWLGLRHTFEGCDEGDHVDDTPSQIGSSFGCPSVNQRSCGSLDLWENYMDYTHDDCMSMFTQGQVERMRAVLELDPMRNSVINSGNNAASRVLPQSLEEQIQVYPNPTQGEFTINFALLCAYEELRIRVVDITGREVWRMRRDAVASQDLDLNIYAKGVYFLRLDIDGQQVVKRIVLQ